MLKYILKPLISYPFLQPFAEEQSDAVILKFKSEKPDLDHSSPVEVFDKIKFVLEVLHKYLLSKLSPFWPQSELHFSTLFLYLEQKLVFKQLSARSEQLLILKNADKFRY